jgi:signal transduction histidine kinase
MTRPQGLSQGDGRPLLPRLLPVRPPAPRLAFSLCLVLVFFALGWTSAALIRVSTALGNASEALDQSRRAIRASHAAGMRARDWLEAENRRATSPSDPTEDPSVRFRFQVSPTGEIEGAPSPESPGRTPLPPFLSRISATDFHVAIINAESDERRRRNAATPSVDASPALAPPGGEEKAHTYRPCWIEGELFLLRRLETGQGDAIQGLCLDVPAIAAKLSRIAAPYLPNATFHPTPPGARQHPNAYPPLSALPFALDVPLKPNPAAASPATVLLFCWLLAALAMIGLAALHFGTVSLGERRAAFASAVTHELRTPLTTFRLHAELLADGLIPPEKQPETFAMLRNEADRLAHLVENVLGYARIERGRPSFHASLVSIGDLVARIEPRIHARLASARLSFTLGIAPGIEETPVRTNAAAVEQILFNLADNAAKYAGAGCMAHLQVSTQKGTVVFDFRDDGPGIPCEIRRHIFRPFFRSAEAAAGSQPGVGLGLAFSRQLARSLGGNLGIIAPSPEAPAGTHFRLQLPLSR